MRDLLKKYQSSRNLNTLVENKTTYSGEFAELNIFETQEVAEKVSLTFDFPVIASMLTGKKVMHIEGLSSFDFYPGESVVMPAQKEMVIDFPLATQKDPTQCMALGIDASKVNDIVERFNFEVAIERENNQWTIDQESSHLINNEQVNHLVERMMHTFINNNKSKDVLLDFMIQELVVRLLQTKAKGLLLMDCSNLLSDTRLGVVMRYIKEHLTDRDMSADLLAEKACMSLSHFHRKFKNTLGISPIEYVNAEKIKFAKKLIRERKDITLSEVAYLSGFNSTSYFNRQFKKLEMMTPMRFKQSVMM